LVYSMYFFVFYFKNCHLFTFL